MGHPVDWESLPNVQRVKEVMPLSIWDNWTQNLDSIYSYESFLRAVSKWPAFCGETYEPMGYDLDQTCKREIATLFTHIEHNYPKNSGTGTYHARGPLGLKGEEMYKAFSADFFEGINRENVLANDPGRVKTDAYTSLSSAIWLYMRSHQAPSAHSIASGFYKPNASDLAAGHKATFGSTMILLSPDACGGWSESALSNRIQERYNTHLVEIGLEPESDTGCARMYADFSWSGSQNKMIYFDTNWSAPNDA